MKRVLVTGATGFIGSFVAERLLAAGMEVGIVHRPGSDLWRLGENAGRVHRIQGDLEEPSSVRDAVRAFAPEVAMHLAWHGVGNQQRNDPQQIERNIRATIGLVEIAAEAGARTWIGAGSQAEYGPQNHPLDEEAPTKPTTLYGATKLAACHLAGRLAALRNMRFAWLRLFSIFGPRDHGCWLIPWLVRALARRERPALTLGEQRWDYLPVEDAASAFHAVAANPEAEGVFNVGSGQARPLRQWVEQIRDLIDPDLPLGFGEVPYRPDQVMFLEADTRRLRAIGWCPKRSLDEALKETVEWYLKHPE